MTLPESEEGCPVGFKDRRPGLVAGITSSRIWQPGACTLAWVRAQKRASPLLKARSPSLGLLPPRPEDGSVLGPEHLCNLPSGAAGSQASGPLTSLVLVPVSPAPRS